MYDEIDMQHQYSKGYRIGFWIGAIAGVISTFFIGVMIGLYL